ncbi:head GIN domain-containing protein [Aureibaculum sp. 2210JD6-5]|uniref:head GIN domain-containing protein n=1 Tax=Aureibaculum sp. 2210JD6-5 TaxID=3103957 RepID=UPI002AADCE67|nr:head GIN domain-containing protein [Aureibaculum sp. 2210JD6-5]MDY7394545.1 head GIN domain-containing protein [Aureibaculum sp. 2210JD6-5]
MKNIKALFVVLVLASATLFAQEATKDLQKFNEIKGYDQLNITLVKASYNKAVITGDDIDKVAIDNKDGLLKVRMEIEKFLDGNETKVTIYHTEDLKLIDANEGATITSEDEIESNYLSLRSQEGAKINVKIDAKNVNIKAVTGGFITVNGETDNQDVLIRTGGEFHGKALESNRADVTIFAGGKAFVNAEDYVDATVNAGGTIEIFGNPKKVKEDKKLGGEIIVRKDM